MPETRANLCNTEWKIDFFEKRVVSCVEGIINCLLCIVEFLRNFENIKEN